MATEIPFLMYVDSMKLKETALQLREFNKAAHMAVSCTALLALIERATSPSLGMATTKELREEYECRMNGDHISRADDYKTFDPQREYPSCSICRRDHGPADPKRVKLYVDELVKAAILKDDLAVRQLWDELKPDQDAAIVVWDEIKRGHRNEFDFIKATTTQKAACAFWSFPC